MRGLFVVLLFGLVACGAQPVATLHDRPAFAGTVKVTIYTGSQVETIEGDLVFDRSKPNWQFTLRRGAHADSLLELPDGQIRAFHDGVPSEPTAADRAAFATVLGVARSLPADATVEHGAQGYRIRGSGREVAVELTEARMVHGGP